MDIAGHDAWKTDAPEPHGLCHTCEKQRATGALEEVIGEFVGARAYTEEYKNSRKRIVLIDRYRMMLEEFLDDVEVALRCEGNDDPCKFHQPRPDRDDD